MMRSNVESVCAQHPDRKACPDTVVDYSPKWNSYGLPVHDGDDGYAASWISIQYCPWCGTKLPEPVEFEA